MRSWERDASWHRILLARIGLQGKLIFCVTWMLILALGSSCWLFARQSSQQVSDIMGEQARQISYALALTVKSPLEAAHRPELKRIGMDLLKTRNLLFIAFYDPNGRSMALASRDPEFDWERIKLIQARTQGLMQVQKLSSPVLGDYLAVASPVLSATAPAARAANTTGGSVTAADVPSFAPTSRLLGYVVVGVSQMREQAIAAQTNYLVAAIGAVTLLISLPIAWILVHRIFLPIRQLVAATRRIAAGELGTQVAIHRPDLIGTLARSFNEMVRRVQQQQQALAESNARLADANLRLAAANVDLEEKVHARTAELEAANKRLSAEIAEKEDFLRAVSHDLNAPLRNISGMAAMLLMKHREQFEQDVVHRLERIQKNVQVETDLISELLELSRIKTRRQRMEAVDVAAMVRDLGEMFENDLRTRQVTLIIDTPLPRLHGERARLRQVFQNLIDNAIKYMGDGPRREIHVGCQHVGTGAAATREFYVRDTGIGIDPEDHAKIFFVFRRGKSQAVQNVAGKGVGLASVKSIVETYGGSIRVESAPGQGSTFRFTVDGKHVVRDGTGGSEARAA